MKALLLLIHFWLPALAVLPPCSLRDSVTTSDDSRVLNTCDSSSIVKVPNFTAPACYIRGGVLCGLGGCGQVQNSMDVLLQLTDKVQPKTCYSTGCANVTCVVTSACVQCDVVDEVASVCAVDDTKTTKHRRCGSHTTMRAPRLTPQLCEIWGWLHISGSRSTLRLEEEDSCDVEEGCELVRCEMYSRCAVCTSRTGGRVLKRKKREERIQPMTWEEWEERMKKAHDENNMSGWTLAAIILGLVILYAGLVKIYDCTGGTLIPGSHADPNKEKAADEEGESPERRTVNAETPDVTEKTSAY